MDDRTTVEDVLVELKHEANRVANGHANIPQTTIETPTVDKALAAFHKQWTKTAEDCIKRAEELERAADELRHRASNLTDACSYLDDVKNSVVFEIESRNRAMSLALVNPKND